MNETVDRGERHGGIGEDLAPFAEGLVGGDQHGAPLVAGADQFEQDTGFGLVLGDVGEVIEDEQVEAVEPVDGGFQRRVRAVRSEAAGRGRWCGQRARASRSR